MTRLFRQTWGLVKQIRYVLFTSVCYILTIGAASLVLGRSFRDFRSPVLYIGLVASVATTTILRKWQSRAYEYLGRFVSVFLFAIGILLILVSQDAKVKDSIPWDSGLLGSGVSISALGLTFLTLFWNSRVNLIRRTARVESFKPVSASPFVSTIHQHALVSIGIIVSFTLLILFGTLQVIFPTVLALDLKWILVASIPLLIALVVGGYVKVVKGFGFELETRIGEPIGSIELRAHEVITTRDGINKETLNLLYTMSSDERRMVARLRFVVHRRIYNPEAIQEYLRLLTGLEYLEIIQPDGAFVCLLPVSLFNQDQHSNGQARLLDLFIMSVEEGTTTTEFAGEAITFRAGADQRIVDVLERMGNQSNPVVVIVDSIGRAIGTVTLHDIEHMIATEVLLEARRKKK